jgi:hypothetical protein
VGVRARLIEQSGPAEILGHDYTLGKAGLDGLLTILATPAACSPRDSSGKSARRKTNYDRPPRRGEVRSISFFSPITRAITVWPWGPTVHSTLNESSPASRATCITASWSAHVRRSKVTGAPSSRSSGSTTCPTRLSALPPTLAFGTRTRVTSKRTGTADQTEPSGNAAREAPCVDVDSLPIHFVDVPARVEEVHVLAVVADDPLERDLEKPEQRAAPVAVHRREGRGDDGRADLHRPGV